MLGYGIDDKGCICLCKDTNFKANHNAYWPECIIPNVVYAYAKILILKQITTIIMPLSGLTRCICLCKDTNFKANHNIGTARWCTVTVVYAYAKILILKQITTVRENVGKNKRLYMPMQRY